MHQIPSELTSATFVKRMFPLDVGAMTKTIFQNFDKIGSVEMLGSGQAIEGEH